ncbi:MAG: helix-turn-helix domain-containing protein [Gemmatimonadetes bacterium]|nr:helix-turn-helix domain-containing protein [Gemmatimonadota bacterium]
MPQKSAETSVFASLKAGIEEMKAIEAGELKPGRVTRFVTPDVAEIRKQMGVSQSEFAAVLGISPRTLQEWEQGRRTPQGPARSLLLVAKHDPEAVLEGVKAGVIRARGKKPKSPHRAGKVRRMA